MCRTIRLPQAPVHSAARGLRAVSLGLLCCLAAGMLRLPASASVPPKLTGISAPLGVQYYLRGAGYDPSVDVARVRALACWFGMVRVGTRLEDWTPNPAGLENQVVAVANKLQEKGSYMLLLVGSDDYTAPDLNDRFSAYCRGLADALWQAGCTNVIFEIGNEPNETYPFGPWSSQGSAGTAKYAALVNAAADAIASVADLAVCTGGTTAPFGPDPDRIGPYDWSLSVMSQIHWDKVLFFGYHGYGLTPEAISGASRSYTAEEVIAFMRDRLAYYSGSANRDVLMTERGWSANDYNDTKRTAFYARLGLVHIRNAVESNVWFADDPVDPLLKVPDQAYDAALTINQCFDDNPKDRMNDTGTAESRGVTISGVSDVQSLAREVYMGHGFTELRVALWLPLDHVGTPQYATLTIPAGYVSATYMSVETEWDDPNRIHVLGLSGNQVTGVPISGMPIVVILRQTRYWGDLNDAINSYLYPAQTQYHTMTSGQTETFQVELRNWGSATWDGEGGADPVMIRIRDDAEPDGHFRAPDWLPINLADPIAAAGYVPGPVATNGTAVLSWSMKAPAVSTPTTYDEQLALYSVSGECRIYGLAEWYITVNPATGVDYVISGLERLDSGGKRPGEAIQASWATTNQGSAGATLSSTTSIRLSSDTVIDSSDVWLADVTVPPLGPLASDLESGVTLVIPAETPPGTYYLGAIADRTGVIPESDESNNTAVAGTVEVLAAPVTLSLTKTGNGSVAVNGTVHALPYSEQFEAGAQVSLQAVPDPGWQFDGWSGGVAGTTNPITVMMDFDKSITASFSQLPYDHVITVGATADPQTVASGGGTYLSATATDGAGHHIASWSWSDQGAGGTFYPSAAAQNPVWVAPGNHTEGAIEHGLTVTATCDGDPPATGRATVVVTESPEQAAGSLRPLWRALLLAYRSIDADYTDSSGMPQHLTMTMPDDELLDGQYMFRQFPALADDYSQHNALVDYDVVFVDRPITTLTSMGTNLYWPSPDDTRSELDALAPPGTYDSVLVYWPQTNHSTGEGVPSGGWGLSIGAGPWSNGATYATVANAPASTWADPTSAQVWLHEWLHGVCDYYQSVGYAMPAGNADGGESHGYVWSPTDGWGAYYRDLMTGHVLDNGSYAGITPDAWQSGSILGTWARTFVDYFYNDTTSSYDRTGTVSWDGTYRIVDLGTATAADNKLYTPVGLDQTLVLTGRVFIPGSGVGSYDSVALAVRDATTEYWATLAYGSQLTQRNNVSIMQNDAWGPLCPLTLTTGWYTVNVLLDYDQATIQMKAWIDGANEPDWQTSRALSAGWKATSAGFRHYGQGTSVDDLFGIETASQSRVALSLAAAGQGSVWVDGVQRTLPWSGQFVPGTQVVIDAVPEAGWSFGGWTGSLSDSRTPLIVVLNADESIVANFSQATSYTLALSGSHGQVVINAAAHGLPWSAQFTAGATVTLEALPYGGYVFASWSGDLAGTTNPVTLAMTGDKTVLVSFSTHPDFADVAADFWAYDQIEAAHAAGVVQGYPGGSYGPAIEVTRDQMAVFIARAVAGSDEQVPAGPPAPSFTDVSTDNWAYKYIEYCKSQSIVEGYDQGNGTFAYRPEDVVNRGQMAVYVARAVAGGDSSVPDYIGTPTFTDVPGTDSAWEWCRKYVEYCAASGIVQGYWDGTYRPENEVTRDQMAVYMQRAFQLPV
jgi:hypothetical protein